MDNKEQTALLEAAGEWAASAADRLRLTLSLAVAEARLAAMSVVLIVIIGVLAGLALFTIWALIVYMMGAAILQLGFNVTTVCLALITVHVGLLIVLGLAGSRVAKSLAFQSTRRAMSATSATGDSHGLATTEA